MSSFDARVADLGLTLYGPHPPHHPLDAVVIHDRTARTSGQLPRIDGQLTCIGTLGVNVSVEAGRHSRSAVGVAALPRGGAVEIEVTVALKEDGLS